jgi:hypothetical protein
MTASTTEALAPLKRLDALYWRLKAYREKYFYSRWDDLLPRLHELKTHASFLIPERHEDKPLYRTYEKFLSGPHKFKTYAAGIADNGPEQYPDLARAIHHFENRTRQLDAVGFLLSGRIHGILEAEYALRKRVTRVEVNGRMYLVGGFGVSLFGLDIEKDVVKL